MDFYVQSFLAQKSQNVLHFNQSISSQGLTKGKRKEKRTGRKTRSNFYAENLLK